MVAKKGPTIVFSKPVISMNSSESRSGDWKKKIWESEMDVLLRL